MHKEEERKEGEGEREKRRERKKRGGRMGIREGEIERQKSKRISLHKCESWLSKSKSQWQANQEGKTRRLELIITGTGKRCLQVDFLSLSVLLCLP